MDLIAVHHARDGEENETGNNSVEDDTGIRGSTQFHGGKVDFLEDHVGKLVQHGKAENSEEESNNRSVNSASTNVHLFIREKNKKMNRFFFAKNVREHWTNNRFDMFVNLQKVNTVKYYKYEKIEFTLDNNHVHTFRKTDDETPEEFHELYTSLKQSLEENTSQQKK
jgi:hypothetical protein